MKKISVITVTYNSEKFISDTIESILEQTSKNFEYIIIDGNSTDKTLEIIEKYRKKFEEAEINFTLVSENDEGIYDAYNKGVEVANNDYVIYINSDDWLIKEAIQILDKNIEEEDDVIYGNIDIYDVEKKFIRKSVCGKLNSLNRGMTLKFPSVLLKKKLILEKGGFDNGFKIAGDYDLILRIYKTKNIKFKYIESVIANMRLGGISTTEINKSIYEAKLVRKKNGMNKIFNNIYYLRARFLGKNKRRGLELIGKVRKRKE